MENHSLHRGQSHLTLEKKRPKTKEEREREEEEEEKEEEEHVHNEKKNKKKKIKTNQKKQPSSLPSLRERSGIGTILNQYNQKKIANKDKTRH